ncbi:MAG: hypothetical protein K2X82_28400 [Gemmataceae bacterium]|nr:hypothetical protein [Gemmataceae bacterium]
MHYDLFFGRVRVGAVTQLDADFPNTWGEIVSNRRPSPTPGWAGSSR